LRNFCFSIFIAFQKQSRIVFIDESENQIWIDKAPEDPSDIGYDAGDTCTGIDSVEDCEGAVWDLLNHEVELLYIDDDDDEVSVMDLDLKRVVDDFEYDDKDEDRIEIPGLGTITIEIDEEKKEVTLDEVYVDPSDEFYFPGDECEGIWDIQECEGAKWIIESHEFEVVNIDDDDDEISIRDNTLDIHLDNKVYINNKESPIVIPGFGKIIVYVEESKSQISLDLGELLTSGDEDDDNQDDGEDEPVEDEEIESPTIEPVVPPIEEEPEEVVVVEDECKFPQDCDDDNPCTTDSCQGSPKECVNDKQSGCVNDDNCIPVSTRTDKHYCDLDNNMKDQKEYGVCNNNYECLSNICIDSECIERGLIRKVFDWFKSFFDF